jgi:hypothetical protein
MRIEQRLLQELETLSACERSCQIPLTSVGAPRARSEVLTAALLNMYRRWRCPAPMEPREASILHMPRVAAALAGVRPASSLPGPASPQL